MQPQFKSSPYIHVVRIVLTLVGVLVIGILLRPALLPAGFGESGLYRPGAVTDEAGRQVRNLTNEACFECHPLIRKLHLAGTHKTVSCEICHGPGVDHVQDGRVAAAMPVVGGEAIRPLCLRCHSKVVQARSPEAIRMVSLPGHLEQRKVRIENNCDQCHHVHAPLKWVREAREMVGLAVSGEESRPWTD